MNMHVMCLHLSTYITNADYINIQSFGINGLVEVLDWSPVRNL
jgi:hypothetical protein